MKNKKPKYGLKFQIEEAQRHIARWPRWMKELARFEGCNHPYTEHKEKK